MDVDGEYLIKLAVEDEKGGFSLDQVIVQTEKPVSVGEEYYNSNSIIQIIPHPVTDESELVIQLPDNQNAVLSIYNALGEMLFQKNIFNIKRENLRYALSSKDFETGVYYLALKNDMLYYSQKFVVVK